MPVIGAGSLTVAARGILLDSTGVQTLLFPGINRAAEESTWIASLRVHVRRAACVKMSSFATVSEPNALPGHATSEKLNMDPAGKLALFERNIIPHLNAAYNLARWLTRNDHDAEDAVQEAYLRAF